MEEDWPTPAVAQSAVPSKKKKEKKIALTEFLSSGSWADEMMDSLPTAPSSRSDDTPASGFGGRGGFSQNSLPRGPSVSGPLPTKPPYTAYVGNLPFDINENELERMFEKVKSARIVRDKADDRPKGFGYVEFDTVDALAVALEQNGKNMGGRNLRVNVAEPPKDRPERMEREDRTDVSSWRRTTPLDPPPRDSRPTDRRRDYAPSNGSAERGEREVSRADSASAWTSKWSPSEPRASPPTSAPRSSESSSRWGSAGPRRFEARQPERTEERQNRTSLGSEGPKERPKLALKPRSAAVVPAAAETTTSSSKPNPFGAAKPRDEGKALREAEERRKQREEEEKAKKEKEQAATKKDSSSEKENKGSVGGGAIAKKAVWNKEGGSPSFATLAAKK